MAIRDFDEGVKAELRVGAAEHGRSMEAEARAIPVSTLTKSTPGPGMGSRIRQRFEDVDGLSFEPVRRVERARAAEFPE